MGVVLIGMMGAGKTTVGQLLAKQSGAAFVDLDALIERRCGLKIDQIFATLGEPEFRRLESEQLASIAPADRQVVSVGGGAPCNQQNFEAIRKLGTVIYLRADPEGLVSRVKNDSAPRPKIARDPLSDIRGLLAEREQYYLRADVVVDADRSADEIVEEIRRRIGW